MLIAALLARAYFAAGSAARPPPAARAMLPDSAHGCKRPSRSRYSASQDIIATDPHFELDLAEEALQRRLRRRSSPRWPGPAYRQSRSMDHNGAPALVDALRRRRTRREKEDPLRYETPTSYNPAELDAEAAFLSSASSMNYPDDRLRLIFTCCHPAINSEAQVALTVCARSRRTLQLRKSHARFSCRRLRWRND